MASTFSFDVVSRFDFQELKNAIDQAQREIQQRYDLKDTGTEIALTEKDITINTASEYSLQAVRDTIESKTDPARSLPQDSRLSEGGAGVRRAHATSVETPRGIA